MLSTTVTVEVQEDELPFVSGTESVTVLAPVLEQENARGEAVIVPKPQLSLEPLFTSPAVILALPLPSR